MSRTNLEGSLERWKFTLLVSAIFGGICGVVGMTLGILSLLHVLAAHRWLDETGTGLLVLAFPLIILAAHCLDKANEIEKAIAIEYYNRTELKG